jgi:ACS family glucarate transporter-like MFS transporter
LFSLVVIRLLLGTGEAIIYPASNRFVAQWVPTQERGLANGLIFAGVGAGTAVAPLFVTYLMVHYGWRSSFWASAVLGLVVGVIWYLAARDVPEAHAMVSPAELAYIQKFRSPGAAVETASPSGTQVPPRHRTRTEMVLNRSVLAVTLSYFCFGYVAWIFFSWFYIYLAKVRGLDLKTSAFYSTLPPIAIVICSLSGGALSDALTRAYGKRIGRCALACVALLSCAFILIVGSRVASPALASLVLSSGVGALYLAQSSYWSISADIGGTSAGFVSGFMNMGAQFGGALTAWLTPVLAQRFGWTASFLAAALLSAAGGIAWLLVRPEGHASPETQRHGH